MWVDGFLIFAGIYETAHRKYATAVLKYMDTVFLGASRSNNLDQVARIFFSIIVPQSE